MDYKIVYCTQVGVYCTCKGGDSEVAWVSVQGNVWRSGDEQAIALAVDPLKAECFIKGGVDVAVKKNRCCRCA